MDSLGLVKEIGRFHGLSIGPRGYRGNANASYLTTSQSERGREVSLGPGRMYTIPFKFACNYVSKVYIIL